MSELLYRPWPTDYSSVGLAARYGLDGPGGGEIFRTRPHRPWGPTSLLYSGYRVFPGGKAVGAWRWPPTPSSCEVREYSYNSTPFWGFVACYRLTFTFIVELDRPQMTIWRMRIACWIPKATTTHSEYVILLFDCSKCYVIRTLPVTSSGIVHMSQ
jgi:hypothetical protein